MVTRSVRIPDEVDDLVTKVAEAEHLSINSVIVQALESWGQAHQHRAEVRAITAEVMAEDADLLARLADA
ncbi:Arc family DNA-binding protein [Actinomadura sp. LD22]|uniref:Arc family DNA-binding protein n=1 Tax=Actinomadura physcomitrii TaxID=2650748 RepID=A0A6I4MK17_9ACTN|nr:Arc family DNA-binding protein [Actinomadura physcomitrii]MWA03971.1 Arc family DNA-binding protein [Actinomadura physcomitrii]